MLSVPSQFAVLLVVAGLLWRPAGTQAQDVQVQAGKAAQVELRELVVVPEPGGLAVKLLLSGSVTPQLSRLESPARVVVDLPKTVAVTPQRRIAVGGDGVKAVRVGMDEQVPPTTRVVVDLAQPLEYELVAGSDHNLILRLHTVPANHSGSVQSSDPRREATHSATEVPGLPSVSAKPTERQPVPTPPLGPLPTDPAEVASAEALVTYKSGELTIKARNAQLSDILRKICEKTDAVLDALSVADERVFADLGPGPVKDVLGALLNNSTFNYVIVGSADDPTGLARVLVFPSSKNGNAERQVNQQPVASTLTAAGETVDDSALLQAAAQPARDANSASSGSPSVDPSGLRSSGRPRHRRR